MGMAINRRRAIALVVLLALLAAFALPTLSQAGSKTGGHKDVHAKPTWRLRPPAIRTEVRNSTAYCLPRGQTMANGRGTHDGAVAVPRSESLGRWYQVRSGPLKGKVLHAEDHIGFGSQFDIWMSSGCSQYGRRNILIVQISAIHARKVLWRQQHRA